MLSDEEKQILWMHYKEKKTLQCIADEIGLSEIAVKKKHRKMLMKIGRMIWGSAKALLFYCTYSLRLFLVYFVYISKH